MDYSHPVARRLRRIGQSLGILRPLVNIYRRLTSAKYEESFDKMMLAEVRAGDIVWDIGANVGHFTTKFSEIVGPTGRVIAFEPSPATVEEIRRNTKDYQNVHIEPIALSDSNGETDMVITETSVTNTLFSERDGEKVKVTIARGDTYSADHPDSVPNCIKIDVEGFELEAIRGLEGILENKKLRALFVEVHFQILNDRGMPEAPEQIVKLLKQHRFAISWADSSHIVGKRSQD